MVLRAAFAQAMRWGWVWDNPAERANRIAAASTEPCPPTPWELRRLLDHVGGRDAQFHVFLVLAAFTGARRAQLLGLRWYNVHLVSRRVSFCAGWVEGPDGPTLALTKNKRRHVVDLDPATFAVLAAHADRRGLGVDGFVFSDDGGVTAWKPNRVTKAFIRHRRAPACGRSGCTTFAIHGDRDAPRRRAPRDRVPSPRPSTRIDHAG